MSGVWWLLLLLDISVFITLYFQPLIFHCEYPTAASLMFAGTGLQYFILFMMFYKKTYTKKETTSRSKEKDPSTHLLEDLGETVERVRRDSLKVVDQVRRNSLTTLGKIRRNSVGKLPPILSNKHLKELEKLQINGKLQEKIE